MGSPPNSVTDNPLDHQHEVLVVKRELSKIGIFLEGFGINITRVYSKPRPYGFDFDCAQAVKLQELLKGKSQLNEDTKDTVEGRISSGVTNGVGYREIGTGPSAAHRDRHRRQDQPVQRAHRLARICRGQGAVRLESRARARILGSWGVLRPVPLWLFWRSGAGRAGDPARRRPGRADPLAVRHRGALVGGARGPEPRGSPHAPTVAMRRLLVAPGVPNGTPATMMMRSPSPAKPSI